MSIQLSISVLASDNHSAALNRCLNSLKPLLMKLPCELIVVLTGTSETVRKIAEKYTEQIVPFEWCNDFSAARNAGLKTAKGEWFLYIDDDEWFENVEEICSFFLSGEYRKYGMACYLQRNYTDWTGTCYTDFQAMRMFKIVPGVVFQNAVHEEPIPRFEPCKYLSTYVHHYGYVTKTGIQKFTRNHSLIMHEINKDDISAKNYIHIVEEYGAAEKWEMAEKYCRKGLELYRNGKRKPDSYQNWLQAELVELLYMRGDYQGAELEADTILNKENPCELVQLDIFATLVLSYGKRHMSEETLYYGKLFEEMLAYMERNQRLWRQQNYGDLSEIKIKKSNRLYSIRLKCIESALELDRTELAAPFLQLLPWDKEAEMQQFYPDFDKWKEKYGASFLNVLDRFPDNSLYRKICMCRNNEDDDQTISTLLMQCMEEAETEYFQKLVIKEALLYHIELEDIIGSMNLDTWEELSEQIVQNMSNTEFLDVQSAGNIYLKKSSLKGLIFEKAVLKRQLVQGDFIDENFVDMLSVYSNCALTYYKSKYRDELFCKDCHNLLPKECQFTILVSEALTKSQIGKFTEVLKILRKAVMLYPEMTGVIKEFTKYIIYLADKPVQNVGEEFQTLSIQMKKILISMITNKQYKEAMAVFTQLIELLPEDLELLRIKQKLLRNI